MNDVVEWLRSPEGQAWAYERFDDATECHDIIEILDDTQARTGFGEATWRNKDTSWWRCRRPRAWRDLEWDPDRSP